MTQDTPNTDAMVRGALEAARPLAEGVAEARLVEIVTAALRGAGLREPLPTHDRGGDLNTMLRETPREAAVRIAFAFGVQLGHSRGLNEACAETAKMVWNAHNHALLRAADIATRHGAIAAGHEIRSHRADITSSGGAH